jgi:CRP/FNR family transcriptional regulator, cyclic AMP receptor protein
MISSAISSTAGSAAGSITSSAVWHIENVDLFDMLCPHKFAEHVHQAHQAHRADHAERSSDHAFKSFDKDDVVYWEQDSASSVYLIASGKIKIVSVSESGEERIKAILGKGELFGEMALFGEDTRRECAVALESGTTLCPMSAETLNSLMRDYKDFALGIRKLIGWKLRRIERRMEILLFKDAETRLCEFIADLARDASPNSATSSATSSTNSSASSSTNGSATGSAPVQAPLRVPHIFTQQDIADLIGIARPTLNQLFNDLRARGVLDFKRREIIVKDRQMFAC